MVIYILSVESHEYITVTPDEAAVCILLRGGGGPWTETPTLK